MTDVVELAPEAMRSAAARLLDAHAQVDATADDVVRLLGACRLERLADGHIICREGDVGDVLFILLEGRVLVSKSDVSGQVRTVGEVSAPTLLGQMAMIDRARRIVEAFDIAEYWQINHAMHEMIATLIGSDALRDLWDRLYYLAARVWYARARDYPDNVAEDLLVELRELHTALSRGDMLALGYVQRNHIAHGLRRLEAVEGAGGA